MHWSERKKIYATTPGDGVDRIPDVPGVYCVLNRQSGHRYVGCSATSMWKRVRSHRATMRAGTAPNMLMRKHAALYGPDVFFYFTLQEHPQDGKTFWRSRLEKKELWWTIHLAAHDERYGYNSEAGHIRTPAAGFREQERRLMAGGRYAQYELLPGVDRYDPIHPQMLETWSP